jgi:hypothetical protein
MLFETVHLVGEWDQGDIGQRVVSGLQFPAALARHAVVVIVSGVRSPRTAPQMMNGHVPGHFPGGNPVREELRQRRDVQGPERFGAVVYLW